MARLFVYEGKEYPDPDPEGKMPVDEVRQSFANFFPELANAETKTSKRGDDDIFTFAKRVGTKGRTEPPKLTPAEAMEELKKLEKCLNGEQGLTINTEAQRLRLVSALRIAVGAVGEL